MEVPADFSEGWPQYGDTLFGSGSDWQAEALIDSSPLPLTYATGYKKAGDAVVAAVETGFLPADHAAYPVCFLYRHYIELMLKGLIQLGYQFKGQNTSYPLHHRIRDLWETCRPLIEEACPDGNLSDTEVVQNHIDEFSKFDPSGEACRYDVNKQGSPSFRQNRQFNLATMREAMNRLSGFLEGRYDYVHELLQYQDEHISTDF